LSWRIAPSAARSCALFFSGAPRPGLSCTSYELRLLGADEVIISTYPAGKSNWLETGIVERLRDELNLPVTHVLVDPDRAAVASR
jgi:hypothetical protein